MNETTIIDSLLKIQVSLFIGEKLQNDFISKYINSDYVDGRIIGTGQSDFTKESKEYLLNSDGKAFTLIDVPGIEGNETAYEAIIKKAVNKTHLVLYVNGSEKKTEPKTVEKIKKYLRNDSDVYSICNIHCLGQANRDIEIDGPYVDSLFKAYKKNEETLIPQTEKVLKEILNENYKGSACINGLLAFSANSYVPNKGSTIVPLNDKGLRKIQANFLKEFSNDLNQMRIQSHIGYLTKIIDEHKDNFENFIVESNKRKLLTRLNDSYSSLQEIESKSPHMIGNFTHSYETMSQNVKSAANYFCSDMDTLISRSVKPVLIEKLNLFYKKIEDSEGKIKKEDYEVFFDQQKDSLKKQIENKFNENYNDAIVEYKDKLTEAKRRFSIDISQNIENASLTLSNIESVDFLAVEKAMQYSLENFKKDAFAVVSLVASGTFAGSFGGPIGIAIGAGIGLLVSLVFKIIQFFQSTKTRITKAKEKAKDIFNEIEYKICSDITSKISFEDMKNQILTNSQSIAEYCMNEIEKIRRIEMSLKSLLKEIKIEKRKLEDLGYGKI